MACDICGLSEFRIVTGNRESAEITLCDCVGVHCASCGGDGRPPYYRYNPETRRAEACVCRNARIRIDLIRRRMKASNIPVKYRYRRLDQFSFRDNPTLAIAAHAAHDLLADLIAGKRAVRGLYLYGIPGSGKTMLANLILNELLLQTGKNVRYIKITRDFFQQMRNAFRDDGNGAEDIFRSVAGVDVLVIDDFGVQADSDWEKRTLYDLIDARYEAELTTIFTSNLSPQDYKEVFLGRILSRIREMTHILAMEAGDYREIIGRGPQPKSSSAKMS